MFANFVRPGEIKILKIKTYKLYLINKLGETETDYCEGVNMITALSSFMQGNEKRQINKIVLVNCHVIGSGSSCKISQNEDNFKFEECESIYMSREVKY